MELCDIQLEDGKAVLTFCENETQEDVMELKLTKHDIAAIVVFFQQHMSFAAQINETMREHVERAVRKFKLSENGLNGKEWNNIYFSFDNHIHLVRHIAYRNLSDADLLRYLLYLTMQQNQVINKRIRNS